MYVILRRYIESSFYYPRVGIFFRLWNFNGGGMNVYEANFSEFCSQVQSGQRKAEMGFDNRVGHVFPACFRGEILFKWSPCLFRLE